MKSFSKKQVTYCTDSFPSTLLKELLKRKSLVHPREKFQSGEFSEEAARAH